MLTTSWTERKQAKGADGIQIRMCSGLYTVYSVDAVAMVATFESMPIKMGVCYIFVQFIHRTLATLSTKH